MKVIKNKQLARIILSIPPLNILSIADLKELRQRLQNLRLEPNLKAITLESDQKVFSAGVSIEEHSNEHVNEMLNTFNSVFFEIMKLEIPTISLVKSGAVGGGCELALFCDFVLAADNAWFSQPEIKLGCFPPVTMVFNNKKALELILTGEKISAQQALQGGLVNRVFMEDEFDIEAEKFINSVLANNENTIKTTLRAYKQINYQGIAEKLKLSEKIYLKEFHVSDNM